MTKAIFLSTSLLLAAVGQAQEVDAKLKDLNSILEGNAKVRLDRNDRLIIDVFINGELVRQDIAYMDYLSPDGVSYNSEELALVLTCKTEEPQCIDKEVFKHNTIKHTGRRDLPRGRCARWRVQPRQRPRRGGRRLSRGPPRRSPHLLHR